MTRLFVALLATAATLGCASDVSTGSSGEISVRAEWLTGDPAGALPDAVMSLKITRTVEGRDPQDFTTRVMGLPLREDGRRYVDIDILKGLPADTPITVQIEGLDGAAATAFLGFVGPVRLSAGERRHIDLKMYEIGVGTVVDTGGMPARFMHTATPVGDGRVLIAGGFTDVENGAACPGGVPPMTRCFDVTASNDAWIFDATTGRFYEVERGMMEARAGHTATSLPDGRVLVAGGTPNATLALIPLGDPIRGYDFAAFPTDAAGERGALDTFEMFLPDANREDVDVDRNGDPGRGAFIGAASGLAGESGLLNDSRFLHAAAVVPGTTDRVLLVGGQGSGSRNWEIFDDQRSGGYGTLANTSNALAIARRAPAAVTLNDELWIFGGNIALNNSDLAEVWRPGADANGMVEVAADTTSFPNPDDMTDAPHPELALARPNAAALEGGTYAIVVGWFGPRCMPGTSDPIFELSRAGDMTEPCSHSGGPPRNFSVQGTTGVTAPVETAGPHGFGAMTTLDSGEVVVSGGIANIIWTRQASLEVFTGRVIDGVADLSSIRYMLNTQRALHTTTALPNQAVLSVGGVNLSTDVMSMSLVAANEVLYLQR